jgi:hypothetical protein
MPGSATKSEIHKLNHPELNLYRYHTWKDICGKLREMLQLPYPQEKFGCLIKAFFWSFGLSGVVADPNPPHCGIGSARK